MKVYISCDMEGATGVVRWEQVSADKPDFTALQLNLVNIGVDIKGAQQGRQWILPARSIVSLQSQAIVFLKPFQPITLPWI